MARPDEVFEIRCECCGATINVDPKTRSVFYTVKPGETPRSFEQVVGDVKSVKGKAADKFEAGLDRERDRGKQMERLEKLFDEASEKAKENPDERPPSIWDYE